MQLCLGTVQFGMNYGICNQKKPTIEEACKMIDYAVHNGINSIDTAKQYGTAEDVIGEFIKKNKSIRNKLFISTKAEPNLLDEVAEKKYYDVLKNQIIFQMKRLGVDYIDAYLFHSARYVYNDEFLEALNRLKKDGYAKYVGVSVYETDEAIVGINKDKVDYLQLPYSIFDQRMKKEGVFELLTQKKNTIVDSRSAFIQGLILLNKEQIPKFLDKAIPIIDKIDCLCKESGISRIMLAMNYVKQQKEINNLVFGVDNLIQLKEDIDAFNSTIEEQLLCDISKEFCDIEANIVMPSLWVKK